MSALLLLLLAAQDPTVPDGFAIRKAAEASFPMFACFDDRGRLYVTESSGGDLYLELQKKVRQCRIRRFEDKDGDGIFETSTVFAEGLVPSMGIAWHAGRIYAADPPDVATYEDVDDDGKADRRRVILTGFGHSDNGSLHGLLFGPDGKLYLTTGEPDGYELPGREGKTLKGMSGALIRCKPDGSDAEVVARGFENLVEIVFLPGGDILGTCNWYQKPAGGIRDALVHLVDGGLYPYCPDKGTPLPRTGILIPPLALFPAVALSGLARIESATFPEAMRGNLLSAQFNARKVVRHVLARSGSTWTAESVDFVSSENPDFHPSDVLEAPDGSMLVVDTGAWYVQHCPTGRIRNSRAPGGIWRVTATGPKTGKRAEPARIPTGLSVELLQKWLPDPAASRALARLANPAAAASLVDVLKTGTAPEKLGAAEALATCGTAESLEAIWNALGADPDPVLEHALVHAALGITRGKGLPRQESILPETRERRPKVVKAQMILLDQSEQGLTFDQFSSMPTRDPEVRRAALEILKRHPDWSRQAAVMISNFLTPLTPSDEARSTVPELLQTFAAEPRVHDFVGQALQKEGPSRRMLILESIAGVSLPSLPAAWKDGIARSLSDLHPDVRLQAVRTAAMLRLTDFDEALAALADRPEETTALRLDAHRAVVERRPQLTAAGAEFLLAQVATGNEAIPRLAAAEILRRASLSDGDLAKVLQAVRGDGLISPSLFAPALAKSGDAAIAEAARSIRDGWRPSKTEIAPWLDRLPRDAQQLATATDAEISAKLARFALLLTGGDPAKGREIFFGKKVACGTCHAVGAQGGRVGPDLTKIGAIRAGRDLVESILVPSSTFAQGYEPYLVLTQDGNVVSGLIARQSADAVVLRDAGGAEVQLRRDRIQSMKRAEKSVMPEGLERALTPEEFRDLLAFLQGLK